MATGEWYEWLAFVAVACIAYVACREDSRDRDARDYLDDCARRRFARSDDDTHQIGRGRL